MKGDEKVLVGFEEKWSGTKKSFQPTRVFRWQKKELPF